ncbi:Kinesin-like protein KIF11 like protein [Argiope bruennichi]|uniref:Kinesin-like protein KIF11 like protein n=2 Tax=Argiope bruennichi TaxID=94029 RepID=A0A8T0FJ13_ARGBR|nr:Kinesin-like protein KIF11 like protein [Argiope bruennichi]
MSGSDSEEESAERIRAEEMDMDGENTQQHCHCSERLFLERKIEIEKIKAEGLFKAIQYYLENGLQTESQEYLTMRQNHQHMLAQKKALEGELDLLPNCCGTDRAKSTSQEKFTYSPKRKNARPAQNSQANVIETSNKFQPLENISSQTDNVTIPANPPPPNNAQKMIPTTCGIDVCAFVQKSGCTCEDSTFPQLVLSSDNEIAIFQDEVSLKTFKYDNICDMDSQDEVLELTAKSITKDVVESINRIMFVYKPFGNDITHAVDMMTFSSVILNNIYTAVSSEENCDISLHVCCIEVNNKGIIDLLHNFYTATNDVKVVELANQVGSNLTEGIVTNTRDIDKILETVFQKTIPNVCVDCRHMIVFSIIVLKNRNVDGFEVMKTGRFILVDIEGCINFLKEVPNYMCNRRESFGLIPDASSVKKNPEFWNCSLSGVLKNFLAISKISVMMSLPSTLLNMEQVHALEIVSEMRSFRLKPVINEKLLLRESLKDYADEIKALEKDLEVLKNNNGILTNHQKYRSLKNRLLLSESQLEGFREERNAFSSSVSNKKETLTRLQQEIKFISIKIEEEKKKLMVSEVAIEEAEQKKYALNLKKMAEVDDCVSMNNLINSIVSCMKNQNSHLLKVKYAYEKSFSSARQLNEDINNHTINAIEEQNRLKVRVNSMLLHLKEVLLNSSIQQNNFILNTNEVHLKFEMLNFWKQHSTRLIIDFHSFTEGIIQSCFSLRNNLCSELVSLNFADGVIIEVIKRSKVETLSTVTSCSSKIHLSVENSIKLLYEVLCLLEISQGKVKEQLKKLESAICCHSNERMKFLSSTNSTMASVQHYFNVQLELSSKINSDIFIHHQELKLSINQELMKIKEGLNSLKKLFCTEQKFVTDKWRQRQTYLFNIKEIGGIFQSLQLCTEEHPVLLDKLRKLCVSSIDELYSIFRDQTLIVENVGSHIKKMFNEIECNIKDCSEGNKERISQQKNDIRANLEIQNGAIIKCINTTRSLTEGVIESIIGGLQNTRNSLFNVQDLKENNNAHHIIFELRNNLNDYIEKYATILGLSEFTLQKLSETVSKQTENLEESVEFNHEELLSSTPSSYHERPKNLIKDKIFLKKLRKIATIQVNPECQNLSLDQESIMNATIMSLQSMSN